MLARVDHRAQLMPLFRELGHLKRITSAGRDGSIATRLFLRAWGELVAGEMPTDVMRRTVGAAVAAGRLGDLDLGKLRELGLTDVEASTVLRAGFDALAEAVDPAFATQLKKVVAEDAASGSLLPFVALLAAQPRAGVTCPGKPRMMLLPAENHADHSMAVAVYAVLLAPDYGADPATVFLAGLGHHLHNAAVPDSGFTGEELLGDFLERIIGTARDRALSELPTPLRDRMREALGVITDDRSPEGRAFHAADVIDRVLEIEQHLAVAHSTMDMVLRDYGLVHAGPVKAFHDATLREVGIL